MSTSIYKEKDRLGYIAKRTCQIWLKDSLHKHIVKRYPKFIAHKQQET